MSNAKLVYCIDDVFFCGPSINAFFSDCSNQVLGHFLQILFEYEYASKSNNKMDTVNHVLLL